MMTAEGLAQVMNDLFNGVAAATIDTGELNGLIRGLPSLFVTTFPD